MSAFYLDPDAGDREDREYERAVQAETAAFFAGQRIGRLGLGAGLCPQDASEAERREWMRGFTVGAGEAMNRRAA